MSFEFELTITMRIDADENGASVCACEITGKNVPVDLIIHIDEALRKDLRNGHLDDLPTNRFFTAKNSFVYDEGDMSAGLPPAWLSVYDWALLSVECPCCGAKIDLTGGENE